MSAIAYKKALRCLEERKAVNDSAFAKNLYKALNHFAFSIKKYSEKGNKLLTLLEAEFDIDNIVSFSDAWSYWDDMYDILYKGKCPRPALDRLLFAGKHHYSKKYFEGIESLAAKNTQKIAQILSQLLPNNPTRKMIDLGAGPGTYSKAFIRQGIASESTCLDLPYAVNQYRNNNCKDLQWKEVDLLNEFKSDDEGKYELVFLSNVLHHFSTKKIARILRNIASSIDKNAFLVIQDYCLWPKPAISPVYASILGVHFALTTEGSRCYTSAEIASMVKENIDFVNFYALINTGQTDLLIFRGSDR